MTRYHLIESTFIDRNDLQSKQPSMELTCIPSKVHRNQTCCWCKASSFHHKASTIAMTRLVYFVDIKVNTQEHFLKPTFGAKGLTLEVCSQTKYSAKLLLSCSESTWICSGMTCSERTLQEALPLKNAPCFLDYSFKIVLRYILALVPFSFQSDSFFLHSFLSFSQVVFSWLFVLIRLNGRFFKQMRVGSLRNSTSAAHNFEESSRKEQVN